MFKLNSLLLLGLISLAAYADDSNVAARRAYVHIELMAGNYYRDNQGDHIDTQKQFEVFMLTLDSIAQVLNRESRTRARIYVNDLSDQAVEFVIKQANRYTLSKYPKLNFEFIPKPGLFEETEFPEIADSIHMKNPEPYLILNVLPDGKALDAILKLASVSQSGLEMHMYKFEFDYQNGSIDSPLWNALESRHMKSQYLGAPGYAAYYDGKRGGYQPHALNRFVVFPKGKPPCGLVLEMVNPNFREVQ